MTSSRLALPPIFWSPVLGLAAIQGSISLMWIIYNLYLPDFLVQYGFPLEAATVLLIVENGLAAIAEPLMGNFSDRAQRWVGTRFPFIAVGVILSSALFLAIPVLVIFRGDVDSAARAGLVMVLISWALAMTVFRSPVMSLLGRYAIASKLPLAASVLTLVGAVAGAIAPTLQPLFTQLGAPMAFATGSFVLLLAAVFLRRMNPPAATPEPTLADPTRLAWLKLILIFAAGAGIAIGFRLMLTVIPATSLPADGAAAWRLPLLFGAIALSALPTGTLAVQLGNTRAMLLGLGLISLSLGLSLLPLPAVLFAALIVILGASFSLVSNGTLPFALSLVPPVKGGLGTGLFFGGGTLGASLFLSLFRDLSLVQSAGLGAIAFLFAGGCVALAKR